MNDRLDEADSGQMANSGIGERKPSKDLFIVDSSFELLNAIEASHRASSSENYLLVLNEAGQASCAYRKIIDNQHWKKVLYEWIVIDSDAFQALASFPRLSRFLRSWYGRYLNLMRMRRVARLARSFGKVDNLYLGHYWAEHKAFMRHFANSIEHKNLILLDDGTDIIDISNRRKAFHDARRNAGGTGVSPRNSLVRGQLDALRRKYWTWDATEAPSVTFFTTFALDTCGGDHLIRNEYSHLRSLAARYVQSDAIYFLGQCLVDDGYMELETYLEYLSRVRGYFAGQNILYVPHPRESTQIVDEVHRAFGFEIKRFDVPIEYQLVTSGQLPKMIASFFCSALESCSNIFAGRMEIACFHIRPEHLLINQDAVERIYLYFEQKVGNYFKFIEHSKMAGFDEQLRAGRVHTRAAPQGGISTDGRDGAGITSGPSEC